MANLHHQAAKEKQIIENRHYYFNSNKPNSNPISPITREQALELHEAIKQSHPDSFIWGHNSFKIINLAGYIRLSSVAIEIVPKISRKDNDGDTNTARKVLLDMLYHSGYCNIHLSTASQLHAAKYNIFELIGYVFAERLKRELSRGAIAYYVQAEDNLSVLRGKLLIKQHMINIAFGTGKVYCQYDEFSMDNPLNRTLKQALILLSKEITNSRTLSLLRSCLTYFADIDENKVVIGDNERFKFDRSKSRFEPLFNLATLLLAGRTAFHTSGRKKNFALLFSMDKLYEQYVTAAFQACGLGYQIRGQEKFPFLKNGDGRTVHSIQPDIVLRKSSKSAIILDTNIILDTKWKIFKDKIQREDYFQMYVYMMQHEAEVGVLLYPCTDDCADGGKKGNFTNDCKSGAETKWKVKYEFTGPTAGRYLYAFDVCYADFKKAKAQCKGAIEKICNNRQQNA